MELDVNRMFQTLEGLLGVTLVLHDRAGILHDERHPLPEWRGYHRHLYCRTDRHRQASYDRLCLEHCFRQVNLRASQTREPFVHTCWKGAQEVVVPLYIGPAHVATLFAGIFRAQNAGAATASDEPAGRYPGWSELPVLDDERRETLVSLLWAAGCGLTQLWQDRTTQPAGRRGAVLNFIHLNAHRNPSLDDLARELKLSSSRTSHLVRELFSCSFQQFLTRVRLDRARTQLRRTTYTIERIALGLGFQSAGYLHRIFLREYGQTPGDYRRVAQADQPSHPEEDK